MTSRDFCFWLQDVFEVGELEHLNIKQTELVKNHLKMVFKHEIDPSMGTEEHQQVLNNLHDNTHPLIRC